MQKNKVYQVVSYNLQKILNEKDPFKIDQIVSYLDLLIKWNKKINLIGHKRWDEIFFFLIIDSFYLFSLLKELKFLSPTILDIGSGAGIPAIPLKILWPEAKFILVESKFKKCVFIQEIVKSLKLKNIKILNKRIEDVKGYKADIVMARAFKNCLSFLETAINYLNLEGYAVYFSNTPYSNDVKNNNFLFFKEKKYQVFDKTRYLWLFKSKCYATTNIIA